MADAKLLPSNLQLEYLAEGAANVVYKILPHQAAAARTGDASSIVDEAVELDGRLLRLHKDCAWMASYAELDETFSRLIEPLFEPSQIISQTTVKLPVKLVATCNKALHASEQGPTSEPAVRHVKQRPAKRHGLYLSTSDEYGLLVEDMSAEPTAGELLIEMKPKWLAQSPNAPNSSTRCRTCALRAMRHAEQSGSILNQKRFVEHEHDTDTSMAAPDPVEDIVEPDGYKTSTPAQAITGHGIAPFCPLDLVASGDEPAPQVYNLVQHILTAQRQNGHPALIGLSAEVVQALTECLTRALHETPLFAKLRDLQRKLDPRGVLSLQDDQVDDTFLVATTLRDCTLFVRVRDIPATDAPPIFNVTIKLGDLDLKAAEEEKLSYWRGLETSLIEGGWYEGRDGGFVDCKLERKDRV